MSQKRKKKSLCIVDLCKNEGIHLFPKDESRKAQWVQAIVHFKPGRTIKKYSLICSAHFKPNDFVMTPICMLQPNVASKILKKTAIPCVFPWKNTSQPPTTSKDQASSPDGHQESLVLNFSQIQKTYARIFPISFVAEQIYFETMPCASSEDPLKCETNARLKCETNERLKYETNESVSQQVQIQQEEHEIESLKLEIEVENDEDRYEAMKDRLIIDSLAPPICGMIKFTLQATEKEVTIKAPWGNIAALSWGDPVNPPVLLCHGKRDVCSGFRPLVSRLPKCFFYLSIDLPGNGKSDHMPKGVRYSIIDLVPTISKVVQHFKWEKFMYIGHSLGVPIGKFYNIAYPGQMTRVVELDPIPAHHTWPVSRQGIHDWFHSYYMMYEDDKFPKYNGSLDTAPKYTYEKAQQLVMQARALPKEATKHVLERCLVPAGDGLYRFTFDQRLKEVTVLPFSEDGLRKIYTTTSTPTFCVISKSVLDHGIYDSVPFVHDEKAWPNNNYSYIIVEGNHDVHIGNPDVMAADISRFLLDESKSKL